MNLHQVFKKVRDHLLTQNIRSVNIDGECMYLDPDLGYKCAIGCLINEDHYDPLFEGLLVSRFLTSSLNIREKAFVKALMRSNIPVHKDALRLYCNLQVIHDQHSVDNWGEYLDRLEYQFFGVVTDAKV